MADNVPTFRREFKRYKKRKPPPDYSDVIDFEQEESWASRVKQCTLLEVHNFDSTQLGLRDPATWKCYEIEKFQGFKVIVNPFTVTGQYEWIRNCVEVYPGKPNVCNLDTHVEIDANLWKTYETHCSKVDKSVSEIHKSTKSLMDRLRWVTLGYHYNWDTKKYSKENFTEFPYDLAALSKYLAQVSGHPGFTPEAAIVNYYHMDSTLSGHTDHSEFDLTAPLFSISFGQTCIFLLGGQMLDTEPCAMFLRSGDTVIMSGDSRLSYHAVPRIIVNQNLATILDYQSETQPMKYLERYLSYSRINVNIRQVEGSAGRFPSD